eukprot:TRINITY_DN2770_c0_g1_i3.p1 TRINITY_DN2770_c0_g1~~TRINITY_DN2770_c0_g1_i3.p1  ORF type:complete len:724 (+),score=172.55 TRINITY_DN2770_c0_g1_i3:33-2204(+)
MKLLYSLFVLSIFCITEAKFLKDVTYPTITCEPVDGKYVDFSLHPTRDLGLIVCELHAYLFNVSDGTVLMHVFQDYWAAGTFHPNGRDFYLVHSNGTYELYDIATSSLSLSVATLTRGGTYDAFAMCGNDTIYHLVLDFQISLIGVQVLDISDVIPKEIRFFTLPESSGSDRAIRPRMIKASLEHRQIIVSATTTLSIFHFNEDTPYRQFSVDTLRSLEFWNSSHIVWSDQTGQLQFFDLSHPDLPPVSVRTDFGNGYFTFSQGMIFGANLAGSPYLLQLERNFSTSTLLSSWNVQPRAISGIFRGRPGFSEIFYGTMMLTTIANIRLHRITYDLVMEMDTSMALTTSSDMGLETQDAQTSSSDVAIAIAIPLAMFIAILGGILAFVFHFRRSGYIFKPDEEFPEISEIPEIPEISLKSSESRWEIDYDTITLHRPLGSGNFGRVDLAEWRNGPCVVKKLLNEQHSQLFWKEMQSMMNIRPHPNVCQLLGICRNPEKPLCIVMEFLAGGSLLSLLTDLDMSKNVILGIARDVVTGMHHLHTEGILHCDLAARNLLVCSQQGETLKIKISDFGLARGLDLEIPESDRMVPVRWSSPEVLRGKAHTKENDVWSFGVTMWEVIENKRPYYMVLSTEEVRNQVISGLTLQRPISAHFQVEDSFWHLITSCWKTPSERPTFLGLIQQVNQLIEIRDESDSGVDQDEADYGMAPHLQRSMSNQAVGLVS